MTLFLTYLAASTLGTLFGGLGLFYIAGSLAKQAEAKRRRELEELTKQHIEQFNKRVAQEQARMKKYAEMEG